MAKFDKNISFFVLTVYILAIRMIRGEDFAFGETFRIYGRFLPVFYWKIGGFLEFSVLRIL